MVNFPTMNNPCIRCGKQRILAREWKETLITRTGESVVTHTLTVCPDPECQAIIDKNRAIQNEKDEKRKKEFEERRSQRKNSRDLILGSKKPAKKK